MAAEQCRAQERRHGHGFSPAKDAYLFFDAAEAAFVEAAVERLVPPDEFGPSALEAGVPHFIDRQLHGAWGAGERPYRDGPWKANAVDGRGYRLAYSPAELFRTALRGIEADVQQQHGKAFGTLSGSRQDAYLTQLQNSPRDLGGVPSNLFFESLLTLTIEGYFSDPVHAGHRDMAAWRLIGFPGACADRGDRVDRHGLRYGELPRSLGPSGGSRAHAMADGGAGDDNDRNDGRTYALPADIRTADR